MNISCSLSINMNRALRSSTSLTSATLVKSFATCLFSSVIGAAIRIVTPRFFAFSKGTEIPSASLILMMVVGFRVFGLVRLWLLQV